MQKLATPLHSSTATEKVAALVAPLVNSAAVPITGYFKALGYARMLQVGKYSKIKLSSEKNQ